MKHKIQTAVRTFVSVALIVILLYIMKGKYGDILTALGRTNIPIFALALAAFATAISIASFRFMLIVKAQGSIPINYKEALSLTFIGYFFNNFLPTAIGGDVIKAYYLSKKASGKMDAYTSVFVDRMIGLITMVFMAFAALFLVDSSILDKTVKQAIYAITIAAVLVVIFIANKSVAKRLSVMLIPFKSIKNKLKEAYNAVHRYRHHNTLLVQSVVISVVSQLFFFVSLGILAFSIGRSIPIIEMLLRCPVISVMSLLPSINGLGLREGGTVLMFGPLIGRESAFAVSILWLLVLIVISVAGGIIYLVSPQFRVKLKDIG